MSDAPASCCAKHPKVETYLKCASCGIPICPDCFVLTPVGYKCKACGLNVGGPLYALSPPRAVAAALVGLAAGVLTMLGGGLGFWGLWLALPFGRLVGGLIQRVAGNKLGLALEILAGASVVLGGVGYKLWQLWPLNRFFVPMPSSLTHSAQAYHWSTFLAELNPIALVVLAIVAATAVSRIRYLWSLYGF